jgi:septum formation protein
MITCLPLILASESPRRREIFRYFTLPFEQVSHTFDEESLSKTLPPLEFAKSLSLEKAKNVHARYPENVVVAADTIVVIDNTILSKPKNRSDAAAMMHSLSGQWHTVITGVSVVSSEKTLTGSESTKVLMRRLTENEIQSYLDRGEWHDKVGGYAIQGVGSLLVERIEGCYYNVMGLPVGILCSMLQQTGVNLWNFLV